MLPSINPRLNLNCYLCDEDRISVSRNRRIVRFKGGCYFFYECRQCRSYSLFPKLTPEEVQELYSKKYIEFAGDSALHDGGEYLSKFDALKSILETLPKVGAKEYLDYGCGFNPVTLDIAFENGLNPTGVELSEDIVSRARDAHSKHVISVKTFKKSSKIYDYIFLGDVIEHMNNPISELIEISHRLSQEGYLIMQGPLEAAPTIAHKIISLKSRIRLNDFSDFPPFHVSLATKKGMTKLLQIANFEVIILQVSETSWPAPSFNDLVNGFSIRGLSLFVLKLLDLAISSLFADYGNHYFLVAKKKLRY